MSMQEIIFVIADIQIIWKCISITNTIYNVALMLKIIKKITESGNKLQNKYYFNAKSIILIVRVCGIKVRIIFMRERGAIYFGSFGKYTM